MFLFRYRGIDEHSQVIDWFWKVLETFTNDEKIQFLRFVSGRTRIPANPADMSQRFQIISSGRVCSAQEPHHEENLQCDFRTGLTQTELYKHRGWLEAGNFRFRKKRNCTVRVVKTKALICFAVSHDAAHNIIRVVSIALDLPSDIKV